MKGLVGGPLLVGAWGPGPLPPPLNPALYAPALCYATNYCAVHR